MDAETDKLREDIHQVLYPPDHPKYQGLAAAKGYSQDYSRIQKVRYSHEAMIDMIIADPMIKQNELAERFDVRPAWISRIIGSDAFQGALAKRREDITNPFLVATIEERLKGLAMHSIDVISKKLEDTNNADIALKSLDIASKALGFGARDRGGQVQNNFIVQMPQKANSAEDWAKNYGGGNGQVIEHQNFSSTATRNPLEQPSNMKLAEI
ncbi:MAG: hypothetical protein E6Q97_39065 [Desulfurellales bacterium]|nr:MAG: hypothetical protein E6Q97_39065 [Desulfurellales bacterium]